MKFTEIEQNLDKTITKETWAKPEWLWNLMLKYREWRCKHGFHKMKNHWGEKLDQCKWCD